MSDLKVIRYELKANYVDQESGALGYNNLLSHFQEINNVVDYRSGNIILYGEQEYNAIEQNFLFLASDLDLVIRINNSTTFLLSEFILIQKSQKFSFSLKSANPSNSPCQANVHFAHGKCL